jgi:predicted secreted protein
MAWTSALAIYLLVWVLTLFAVLPFGVRTSDEAGEDKVRGQADSAPHRPMIGRKLIWTTIVSAVIFGAFWLAFSEGWLVSPL